MTETLDSEVLLRHLQINLPEYKPGKVHESEDRSLFISKWNYSWVTVK
jgi:hypothetical protein